MTFHRFRRSVALVALTGFLGVFDLPFLGGHHLLVDDDPGCGQEGFVPLHEVTQVQDAVPPVTPEHCALCHWLRTFSGAQVSAPVLVADAADLRDTVRLPAGARARTHVDTGRSSRAPPQLS